MQSLKRERRVANPRVAVVPVALAARGLGQRRGQGGHSRTRRHVRQPLDRERRALDQGTELVVGDPGPRQPVAPEARRRAKQVGGLLDRCRRRSVLVPRDGAKQLLALAKHVPRAHMIRLDPEQHVGLQPHRLTGAGRVRAMAIRRQRPLRQDPAVIKSRLAHQLDLNAALEALDRSHQYVISVLVGRRSGVRGDRVLAATRAHRQRVVNLSPSR